MPETWVVYKIPIDTIGRLEKRGAKIVGKFFGNEFFHYAPKLIDSIRASVGLIGEFSDSEIKFVDELATLYRVEPVVRVSPGESVEKLIYGEDGEKDGLLDVSSIEMDHPMFRRELERQPRSLRVVDWRRYLGRKFTKKQLFLFHRVQFEAQINSMLNDLYHKAADHSLRVPKLTGLVGDCMFESLHECGLPYSVVEMRQMLSWFFFQYADYKDLFPGQSETLRQLFEMANEVGQVECRQSKKVYKYTYEVMCQDIADEGSWTKMPTEILLRVISLIFGVEIQVINSTPEHNWENLVTAWTDADTVPRLFIGHLGESHYVPLIKMDDPAKFETPYYDQAWNEWTQMMAYQKLEMRLLDEQLRNRRRGTPQRELKKVPSLLHSNRFSALAADDDNDRPVGGFTDMAASR